MNIKLTLIHLLGGITVQEAENNESAQFYLGRWDALTDLKQSADSINGTNADDWSKAVYNRIKEGIDDADRRASQYCQPEE